MVNIWMLAAANLRKNKGQTVSLLLFILIAAMLLNLGLVVSLRLGSFFDEQAELSHTPHLSVVYKAGAPSIEQGRRFMKAHPDVVEIESTSAAGGWGNYYLGDAEMQGIVILSSANTAKTGQRMDPPALVGESLPLAGDGIYIPYTLFLNGVYTLGGPIKLKIGSTELDFTVAGATKEITFGSQSNPFLRFYLPEESMAALNALFPKNGLTLLSARIRNLEDASIFSNAYSMNVSDEGALWVLPYDVIQSGRVMITATAAAAVVALSIILLVVSLIVVRFRIVASIEDGMTNIGAQKALGYRSVQIISAIVLQFALIALAGGVIGIAISQALIPVIMKVWESMLGLVWNPGFDVATAAIAMVSVLVTSAAVSYLSARKINSMHPLVALRGGTGAYSFGKNHLSLDNTRGPLDLLLALKRLLRSKKQTVSISIIVAAVTMASVVSITFSYNMNERRIDLARSIFGEIPHIDVVVKIKDNTAGSGFSERIAGHPDVRKVFGYTGNAPTSLTVDGTVAAIITAEDCALMESDMVIEGRYPKHDNEIALGTLVMKDFGKEIGDTVIVGNSLVNEEYIVTGIVQVTEGNGFNGLMNGAGMRRLKPDFKFGDYAVYLRPGTEVKPFIESIRVAEGDIFEFIIEEQNQVNNLLDSTGGIFAAITTSIFAATVFVIVLVLYMIIKMEILRRRRELGIQKAVGFTTFQLMNQIALNMTPMILLGVIIGAVAGYFGVNPIVVAIFSGMGISKLELAVPLAQTVFTGAALVALAYAVSLLISWRIRKVSAYALVTDNEK